jgi:predicted Zn-dependent protease with MMP-like domain
MKQTEFDRLVESAVRKIPRRFRDALDNLEIVVEHWPDPDLMEEVTGDRDAVLYGLFTGRPLTERSFDNWGEPPALIHIYQGPLEEDFPERGDLIREIEVTVVHEIAHFMGFDEEILEEYGYD